MLITSYLAVFVGGVLLALVLTPAVRRLAVRLGAIDQPGERKIHAQPVPRLGGVAVLIAVSFAVAGAFWLIPEMRPAITSTLGAARWGVLASAVLLICAMGAIDDFGGLPARLKFLIEITAAAAVVLVAGAPEAIDFSPFSFSLRLGYVAPLLAIFFIIALTNAVNMTDGVDGVAGGISAIAALTLGTMSVAAGHVVAPVVLFALAGALVGFLPHNFRTPKVFLGDTGSLGVGFVLGAAVLIGLQRDGAWLIVPAVLALAVPLTELGLTVLRRTLRALTVERTTLPRERFVFQAGWPGLFVPDRRHIPHRLLELGLSKRWAIAALYAIGATLGGLGLAAFYEPELGPFIGLTIVAVVIYFAPRWLYHELRLIERGALLPILESRLLRSRALQATYDGAVVFVSCLATEAIVMGPAAVLSGGSA
ncbi:MAG: hypothetical protein GWM93_10080, partial [Gemmatimonadetes bacterium]|nr:undecaprenyl/decaprenyl-phosphate alpha-N-acetylglucosaminyl 1-phosphate transferase [Gemmatimonadota bacterium]NIR75916.1 undecaprenyl/decaprenyl-phosphate alpha-N-acetylglucosaminyl 1-phosphate transferase [Candidatus Kutchimonas denitrificans]NIT67009.1 undecaprenyl/decaprenyl-phosphate alpha-N-acetylglucosaminyl 1-phosphate transferase [Gemmatimonadota bacterium]NIY35586.1 hypothetical protein [Gemmatimonadota bacterium]